MNRRKILLGALLLATVTVSMLTYAGVVVVYPITGQITEVAPPVIFEKGDNADEPGLGGNTLTVSLGANKTSAHVSLQATYQTTFIHDVLRVSNTDNSQGYYIKIAVEDTISASEISEATLHVDQDGDGTYDVSLDLTTSGSMSDEIFLDKGASVSLDFKIVIPEGASLSDSPISFSLKLLYSPESGGTNVNIPP